MKNYYINSDITKAETLPATFYQDAVLFEDMKDTVFAKSWQWLGDSPTLLPLDEYAHPVFFLENFLHEPMVLVRDRHSKMKCLSNVCTHRGNLITHNSGKIKGLNCMYHGRRWDINGGFKSMPEFKEALNFPRPCDDLYKFNLQEWGPFLFTGLSPEVEFSIIKDYLNKWVDFLPLNEFKLDTSKNRDYLVNCHWALYCDNYLEGFHIPFVHPDLNAILDYKAYTQTTKPFVV